MKLTRSDIASPTWQKLEKHLTERLADKRKANDQDKDAISTAKLRGHIACLKEILALADLEQAPEPSPDESD